MPDITPGRDPFQDVLDFMKDKAPMRIRALPSWPAYDVMIRHGAMVQEEYNELVAAMGQCDFAGIVDGALDLVYVLYQLLIGMGVDARPIWQAIQEANMSKLVSEDGSKVMKPEGFVPPDVSGIIAAQTNRLNG
jgi:predicted HAD superfamily Cof-like phosphohydrolase